MAASSKTCDQELLNDIMGSHSKYIKDLGIYEGVGRTMGVSGKGLAYLFPLVASILTLAAWANLFLVQLRDSIVEANRRKTMNGTGLQHRLWAGQRAERIITVLAHVRRLWREPLRLAQCLKKTAACDIRKIMGLVRLVKHVGPPPSVPSPVAGNKKRKLKQQVSDISVDSKGFPCVLGRDDSESEAEEVVSEVEEEEGGEEVGVDDAIFEMMRIEGLGDLEELEISEGGHSKDWV
jgi:hypothetical protein